MFHLVEEQSLAESGETFGSLALNGPSLLLLWMIAVAPCKVWVMIWRADGCGGILTQLSTLVTGYVIPVGQVYPKITRTTFHWGPLHFLSLPHFQRVELGTKEVQASCHKETRHLSNMIAS